MSGSIFDVLVEYDNKLADLGYQIEKDYYTSPSASIVYARQFAEKLIAKVCEIEEQKYLVSLGQYERIKILYKDGILEDKIFNDFNDIRIIGNKAVHEGTHNDMEYSARIHKEVYEIMKWYIECYGDATMEVPLYQTPVVPMGKKGLDEAEVKRLLKEQLNELLNTKESSEISTKEKNREVYEEFSLDKEKDESDSKKELEENIVNTEMIEYNYLKNKGSYLLNELSRLSSQSKEGVESHKGLNYFKKYLHVKRSIQTELVDMIEDANNSEGAQLVLLCGSVGDGKSHLLAYLNEEHKQLLDGFYIHNDATESHDPNLTELETLDNVLCSFRDENIYNSNEKIVLAINLGVLNNFLETDFAKEKYSKFNEFVNKSNIFNQTLISSSHKDEHFKLVSFGDYNIYELTENGAESFYIEELLKRIVEKTDNNPFYQAYLKDKSEGITSSFIINYELLSKDGVTKKISDLLVSAIVKDKKILGTRELLNFIYELMVPAVVEDDRVSIIDILKEVDNLLPNLIFNCGVRGELLRIISKNDPIKIRHKDIDKLLIQLNIVEDIIPVLKQYFNEDICIILEEMFKDITNLNELSHGDKEKIIETIIRLLALAGNKEISYVFEDQAYKEFMKYLYYFNKGEASGYLAIFKEVKDAIYKWNGSPKDKYVFLNKNLYDFKVAEEIDFNPHHAGSCPKNNKNTLERFKSNISLGYETSFNKGIEVLELDYQLYKKIVEINKGYCASKNDKEESVIFLEFIEKLLSYGNMEEELLIEYKKDNKKFILKYKDGFGGEEFSFEGLSE